MMKHNLKKKKKHVWVAATRLVKRGNLLPNQLLSRNLCLEVANTLSREGHKEIQGMCGGGGSPKALEEMNVLGTLVAKI